eukprot:TRINITY_DN1215_c0_g1_i1.p1 TRINITY_DN1215_c0_g1~~TRINITY_DN1215_c0_g1_i1.p1  ORF type:complete len:218 (-),score=53.72 TRINITY_DN1215_c0_g1_i1:36-599(-)
MMGLEGIKAISDILELESVPLEILDISKNEVDDEGAEWLAEGLLFCHNLRSLDIRECEFSEKGVGFLTHAITEGGAPNLERIDSETISLYEKQTSEWWLDSAFLFWRAHPFTAFQHSAALLAASQQTTPRATSNNHHNHNHNEEKGNEDGDDNDNDSNDGDSLFFTLGVCLYTIAELLFPPLKKPSA